MVKIIGAALILSGCFAAGIMAYTEKKRLLSTLKQLIRALEFCSAELAARLTPLPELIVQVSEQSEGSSRTFFKELSRRMDMLGETAFSELWSSTAKDCLPLLSEKDREAICALGQFLGRFEVSEQQTAIRECVNGLQKSYNELIDSLPMARKLFLGLTVSAGTLLILILG